MNKLFVLFFFIIISYQSYASVNTYDLSVSGSFSGHYIPLLGHPLNKSFSISIKNNLENKSINKDLALIFSSKVTNRWVLDHNDKHLPISFKTLDGKDLKLINNEYVKYFSNDFKNTIAFDLAYFIKDKVYSRPGTYTLDVELKIVDRNTKLALSNTKTIEFNIIVDPALQVNLAHSKSHFEQGSKYINLDFGEFSPGDTEKFYIQVRGNTDANVTVKSENSGRMIHSIYKSLFIDYQAIIDGTTYNLKSPILLQRKISKNPAGSNFPVILKIGQFQKLYSGHYKDIIYVDISPQ